MVAQQRHALRDLTISIAVAVAALGLVVGLSACGQDDPVETTTGSTTTDRLPSTSTVELTVDEAIAKGDAALADAGSDLCKIVGALRGVGKTATPSNAEETRAVVEFLGRQYDQIADALEVTDPGNAAKLRNLTAGALGKVRDSGYDPATLQSFGTDPDFQAINEIIVGKCPTTS